MSTGSAGPGLTTPRIARFWSPLAATWVMMAMEGPFLAALIARLPDPKPNLAAHGVAFAMAVLIEAPVIMLMSASTALARDRESYRRLRNFAQACNVLATATLLLVLIPPVYETLATDLLGLPREVSTLTYGALWFFLPWPSAIGYRRFVHGVLIRAGRTRLVALGTILRLAATIGAGTILYSTFDWPGAWIGAASLSVGVITEAVIARWMAAATIRETLAIPGPDPGERGFLDYPRILEFYYPLALTSLIGLAAHPMLTFFMGRARAPLESLAVFPVVHALSFVFRAMGLSYQEAAIALVGDDLEEHRAVSRFGMWLGIGVTVGIALIAFTPLFDVWFLSISGLTEELAAYARVPAMVLLPLPALSVWLSVQRAILVQGRRTKAITVATALEVSAIALVFATLGWGLDLVGVTAAILAFVGGRLTANLYLSGRVRGLLGSRPVGTS